MLMFRVSGWDCLGIVLGGCEAIVGTAMDGACVIDWFDYSCEQTRALICVDYGVLVVDYVEPSELTAISVCTIASKRCKFSRRGWSALNRLLLISTTCSNRLTDSSIRPTS